MLYYIVIAASSRRTITRLRTLFILFKIYNQRNIQTVKPASNIGKNTEQI